MIRGMLVSMSLSVILLVFQTGAVQAQPVPQQVDVSSNPCTLVLNPVDSIPNARGVALLTRVSKAYRDDPKSPLRSREAVGIYADWMPDPSSLGDFDRYEGFAQVPGEISWSFKMIQVKGNESWFGGQTWVGKFDEITYVFPTNMLVQVRLYNSKTQKLGPVVLHNTLHNCGVRRTLAGSNS